MHKISIISLAVFILCLSACGKSPLFNHKTEGDGASSAVAQTQQDPQEGQRNCMFTWTMGEQTLCAQVEWILPPIVGENKIRLKFDAPVVGQVLASADMPDMGHGTAPITVVRVDERTYEMHQVWLIMGGLWVIHVAVNDVDAQFRVEL